VATDKFHPVGHFGSIQTHGSCERHRLIPCLFAVKYCIEEIGDLPVLDQKPRTFAARGFKLRAVGPSNCVVVRNRLPAGLPIGDAVAGEQMAAPLPVVAGQATGVIFANEMINAPFFEEGKILQFG
jgi:hypothetical protein